MTYIRVLPRDFFNEAKILKSLGRLSLGILDNVDGVGNYLREDYDGEAFDIMQNQDGELYVYNYQVLLNDDSEVELFSLINSKLNYPLMFLDDDDNTESVFDENGKFTDEFLEYVKQ